MKPGFDLLISKLTPHGLTTTKTGWRSCCPFHTDEHPSLDIKVGDNGSPLIKCRTGCSAESVLAALGLTWGDVLREDDVRMPMSSPAIHSRAVSSLPVARATKASSSRTLTKKTPFPICNLAGDVVAIHTRLDWSDGKKTFAWSRPDGTPGLGGTPCADLPLEGTELLGGGEGTVILCEGEGAAIALRSLGVLAVGTVTGASGTPSAAVLAVLKGFDVFAWPDCDTVGRDHMGRIGGLLQGVAKSARVITWGTAEGDDAGDFVKGGGTRAQLDVLMKDAAPWSPSGPGADASDHTETEKQTPRVRKRPTLGQDAFIGPLGDLVRVLEPTTEADTGGLLMNALTFFGSAVGHGPRTMAGSAQYANLYVATVGKTAQARKGTGSDVIQAAFDRLDPVFTRTCVHSGASSGEGLIWHVRDPLGEGEKADPGAEDKRALLKETEFASALNRMKGESNSLSAILRAAWDGVNLQTLTRKAAGRDPLKATGAHVSGIFHITAEELRLRLDPSDRSNGLSNRILWCFVDRSKLLFDHVDPDEGQYLATLQAMADGIDFARKLGDAVLMRDEGANELWRSAYREMSEEKSGNVANMTTRAPAQASRIAMIFALAAQSRCIQRKHLAAGLAVTRFVEESVIAIFGDEQGTLLHDKLLTNLEGAGDAGMNRTQIHKALGGHFRRWQVEAALADLEASGQVYRAKHKTKGRSDERFYASEGCETSETSSAPDPSAKHIALVAHVSGGAEPTPEPTPAPESTPTPEAEAAIDEVIYA